mmetsp:Transcript_2186/g.3159  ORF Transcript_2186/g.3159 Transcript_2186/m.3159 type:complete len:247 (+) Transcript_2186:1889-2629(+)
MLLPGIHVHKQFQSILRGNGKLHLSYKYLAPHAHCTGLLLPLDIHFHRLYQSILSNSNIFHQDRKCLELDWIDNLVCGPRHILQSTEVPNNLESIGIDFLGMYPAGCSLYLPILRHTDIVQLADIFHDYRMASQHHLDIQTHNYLQSIRECRYSFLRHCTYHCQCGQCTDWLVLLGIHFDSRHQNSLYYTYKTNLDDIHHCCCKLRHQGSYDREMLRYFRSSSPHHQEISPLIHFAFLGLQKEQCI